MRLNLLIFDPDPVHIAELKMVFKDLPSITIERVERMLYLEPPRRGIDILYLPLAAAARFGSRPLVHKSLILPTFAEDVQTGLPPFIVTGTCLAANDPRDPVTQMRILLTAVFEAIRSFNEMNGAKLQTIGFWGYDLLRGITSSQLREIVVEVVPEVRGDIGK
jgi:hypothetical protein